MSTQIRVLSGSRNESFSHIETRQNAPDTILKELPVLSLRQYERAIYPGKDFAQAFKQPTEVRGIENGTGEEALQLACFFWRYVTWLID